MPEFTLSAKQIQRNWVTFRELVNEISPSRKDAMNRMYDDLEDRAVMAPASTYEFFHNAIPGGYIDHVLRVYEYAIVTFEMWQKMGMKVDNFTLEELSFAVLHHDLGKLGLPGLGNELYQPNKSEWHRKNQGKLYQVNPNLVYMETTNRTFHLLSRYGIQYTETEQIGIQLTDGLYNEANKTYLISFNLEQKLRNTMGIILHHADLMAARFEFERWAISSEKFVFTGEGKVSTPQNKSTPVAPNLMDTFSALFPESK